MVDTDTCIAIIKGHAGAIKKLRGKSIGQVGISAITLSELNFGAAKSSRPEQASAALAEFTLALEVAAFDAELAPVYGSVRASLAKRGMPIGPLDTLIGSHALALDSTLVTHNTREFSRIEGLRLEDWIGS
ncbi:MAG: type II toxin-antitoxin system VapC family toxin [Steroidobacteraceae bacterium]